MVSQSGTGGHLRRWVEASHRAQLPEGILLVNRNQGQRGASSATIALTIAGWNGRRFQRQGARVAGCERNPTRGGGNGGFVEFGDVGLRVGGRYGVQHIGRLFDPARGVRALASAATAGGSEDAGAGRADLVKPVFCSQQFTGSQKAHAVVAPISSGGFAGRSAAHPVAERVGAPASPA